MKFTVGQRLRSLITGVDYTIEAISVTESRGVFLMVKSEDGIHCEWVSSAELLADYMVTDHMVHENKQVIAQKLEELLKLTRAGENVSRVKYDDKSDTVKITYTDGSTRIVNVACDSGIALCRDVLKFF